MINENVQKLKNTIRAGRAMHGYLVTSADCDETAPEGEPSSTAELLRQCAALLLFGSEKTEMLEFSPDFYELNGGAKVEQMRMIRQELSKKAFGGNNRVVVITDAHMMNDSAVNAMLKMLEEPPEGTFFLLTGIEQRILPTIRSRCQIVRLGTASAAEIGAELIRLGAAKSEAQRFAAQSMGSLTRAKRLMQDEAFQKLRQNAIEALLDIFEGKLPFKWAKSIGRDRQAAKESLGFMLAACHDVLNKKTGAASGSSGGMRLNNAADALSFSAIHSAVIKIAEAEMRLSSNAGVNPILDRLIIDIAEAIFD